MRIASLADGRLHWREDGDASGRPVVFLNSLGTDLRVWDAVIPLLSRRLRLVRFDTRGHGLSSCPPAPYALDDLVSDAERLLDGLGIGDAVIVGLSVGGMTALGLGARRPDLVRAIVLSNSAARMGTPEMWAARIDAIKSGGIEAVADAVLERWFGKRFRQTEELEAWRNMLVRTPTQGYVGCCQAIAGADLAAVAKDLRLPVLGIGGAEDGASPPETVRDTVGLIAGGRYREIAGVGHLPCAEDPKAHAELIAAFLKEIDHV